MTVLINLRFGYEWWIRGKTRLISDARASEREFARMPPLPPPLFLVVRSGYCQNVTVICSRDSIAERIVLALYLFPRLSHAFVQPVQVSGRAIIVRNHCTLTRRFYQKKRRALASWTRFTYTLSGSGAPTGTDCPITS